MADWRQGRKYSLFAHSIHLGVQHAANSANQNCLRPTAAKKRAQFYSRGSDPGRRRRVEGTTRVGDITRPLVMRFPDSWPTDASRRIRAIRAVRSLRRKKLSRIARPP